MQEAAIDEFFSHLTFVDIFNFCVFLAFLICYAYQIYYIFEVLTHKDEPLTASKNHRYAVLISARNERTVIANLIHSIKVQNYPAELIDIFVIADNCTDDTAQISRDAGAIVFERFNDGERLVVAVNRSTVPFEYDPGNGGRALYPDERIVEGKQTVPPDSAAVWYFKN